MDLDCQLSSWGACRSWQRPNQGLQEDHIPGGNFRTLYITYAVFRAAAVGGKAVADKSSGEQGALGDLVVVSLIDEVSHLLGTPEYIKRGTDL